MFLPFNSGISLQSDFDVLLIYNNNAHVIQTTQQVRERGEIP